MNRGEYTAGLGKQLKRIVAQSDSDLTVYYDHGDTRSDPNVCSPTPFFGKCSRSTTLSNSDIAIVRRTDRKVLLVCEIEENQADPKKLLGDIGVAYLADGIRIQGGDYVLQNVDFVLGLIVKDGGNGQEKAFNIRDNLASCMNPRSGSRPNVEVICETDFARLIPKVKDTILRALGLAGGI